MSSEQPFTCRICSAVSVAQRLAAREMMFGTREAFDYAVCGDCGTLQIARIPDDLGRHYPAGYYSFASSSPSLRERAKLRLATALVTGPLRGLGERVSRLRRLRATVLPAWMPFVPGLSRSHRVLDVGTGGGALLARMSEGGFQRLEGVDPFLSETVETPRFRVRKAELAQVDEQFDLVMMHHALEHVADPVATLGELRRVTAPGRHVVVSIPVAQGLPWRKFGVNWVHLDAPRHLHLFTVDSLTDAARRQGLRLVHQGFDTTRFTFAGSRLYERDVPLTRPDGGSNLDTYGAAELGAMDAEAAALNASGDADTAFFILTPA